MNPKEAANLTVKNVQNSAMDIYPFYVGEQERGSAGHIWVFVAYDQMIFEFEYLSSGPTLLFKTPELQKVVLSMRNVDMAFLNHVSDFLFELVRSSIFAKMNESKENMIIRDMLMNNQHPEWIIHRLPPNTTRWKYIVKPPFSFSGSWHDIDKSIWNEPISVDTKDVQLQLVFSSKGYLNIGVVFEIRTIYVSETFGGSFKWDS